MPLTAANIVADMVRDAGSTKQYTIQGLLSYAQVDRSHMVTGLTAAGSTAATAVSDVENLLKATVPVGTPHPNDSLCLARYYSVRPVESSDAAQGIVSYVYNSVGDTTVWTISSDGFTEFVETDSQYDTTGKLVPIVVANYILGWVKTTDPIPTVVNSTGNASTGQGGNTSQEQPQQPAYGQVSAPKRRKRWTYTKQIYSAMAAQTFDNQSLGYLGCLNSVTFTGVTQGSAAQNLNCARGTVLCYDAGLSVAPYQGQRIANFVAIYRPEGWQPYARFSNSQLGIPDNLWRADPNGQYDANGVVQTTAIPYADLNQVLALI